MGESPARGADHLAASAPGPARERPAAIRPQLEAVTAIRPQLPPRVIAAAREPAGASVPPAIPDVHIHIGRIELTALAAPAARREAPPAERKPMSLEDYLGRRNGGRR